MLKDYNFDQNDQENLKKITGRIGSIKEIVFQGLFGIVFGCFIVVFVGCFFFFLSANDKSHVFLHIT